MDATWKAVLDLVALLLVWAGTAAITFVGVPALRLIREYLNRVACDRPVSGFPLLEEFVTPFG